MPRDRDVPEHITENIETMAALRTRLARELSPHQRVVERVTRVIGRPAAVYVLLAFALGWAGANTVALALGHRPPDPPPFFWLQGLLGLYAAIVATSVLAAQNRQRRDAEQRGHLELQVNLLAEQKTTKIIALLEELRRDLPIVKDRVDPVAQAMQEEVDPKAVLSALESTMMERPSDLPPEELREETPLPSRSPSREAPPRGATSASVPPARRSSASVAGASDAPVRRG